MNFPPVHKYTQYTGVALSHGGEPTTFTAGYKRFAITCLCYRRFVMVSLRKVTIYM